MDQTLIIKKGGIWDLYAIELRRITTEGDVSWKGGVVSDSDDADLKRLLYCCQWTTPQFLYTKGGSSYPSLRAFIDKAGKPIRDYLSQQVGQRILEAIRLAAKADIPIWMDVRPGDALEQANRLTPSLTPLPLHPHFNKTDSGILYRLTVADDKVPSASHAVILSNRPAIVIVDKTIYTMDEGLNGMLLKPFLDKETVSIPLAMQDKYFRTFILRMTIHNDVEAEGFDITDLHPEGQATIILEQTISGSYGLFLQYSYDGTTFTANEKREKRVRMHDDGTTVSFHRIYRNRDWESQITVYLIGTLHMPQEGTLRQLVAWLGDNETQLSGHGITVKQHVSKQLYIGTTEVKEDVKTEGPWLHVRTTVLFSDGTTLPLSAFRKYINEGRNEYNLPNGQTFIIPKSWFTRYGGLMLFGRVEKDGSMMLSKSQKDIINTDNKSSDINSTDNQPTDNRSGEIPLPQSLQATLRPYQLSGYEWLMAHYQEKAGCILGDDMGLGKTVQTIALIAKYIEEAKPATKKSVKHAVQLSLFDPAPAVSTSKNPVLVVAPASVVHNWRNEFRRFAPSLTVLRYTGPQQERQQKTAYIQSHNVVITTYQTLRNDIDVLKDYHFAIAVYDEAQAFKNRESLLYSAIAGIRADFPLALSGTPMENNLAELWAVMSILNPQLLGDYSDFDHNFIHPITDNLESRNTAILQRLLAPYFLRRIKENVLKDLPERQDEVIVCPATSEQQQMHEEMATAMKQHIQAQKDHIDNIYVLAAITRLRQIACTPLLTVNNREILLDKRSADALCQTSGKLTELFRRLEELRGTGHKALLFSDYTGFLDIIAAIMEKRGWKHAMLTGQTRDREATIATFQNNADCQFFLVSLKAGGVGLNLTSADYVFLLDPWWNTAAEEQAVSRAHRIGQHRSVFVYRMITEGTLEEKIMNVKNRKQSLIDAVLKSI